jgi:hypothetical protein
MGRTQEALELLEGQPAGDVDLGVLMAHLIEATGDLSRARELAERLLRKAPKALPLHRLRARVLLAEGDRIGAMQTLDTALSQLCSSGKCGTQPFDVEAGRMLARLYLEDRVEPRRARELMGELSRATQKPGWTDRYLQALAARNAEEPEAVDMARRLLSELREQTDPRRAWITRSFEQLRQASLPG